MNRLENYYLLTTRNDLPVNYAKISIKRNFLTYVEYAVRLLLTKDYQKVYLRGMGRSQMNLQFAG